MTPAEIALLRSRVRIMLDRSWRQEQDGEAYVVFRVVDYDNMRNALSDLLEVEEAKGQEDDDDA